MTAATYAWNRYGILANEGFDGALTGWAATGSAAYSAAQNHGTYTGAGSAEFVASDDSLVQTRIIREFTTTTDAGRWISTRYPLLLEFWAKQVTPGFAFTVVFTLLDDTGTVKYGYNWWTGKWDAKTTEAASKPYYAAFLTSDWERFSLPKIQPLLPVDATLADNWRVRVRFTAVGTGGSIFLDDVLLTQWPGDIRAEKLGPYTIITNGLNYPVKFDPYSGTVTELSLHDPYPHTALPTTTPATTGGEIPRDHYIGFAYQFKNDEVGDTSGGPLGVRSASGYFTEQVGATTDTNEINVSFSSIILPNTEADKDTDDTHIDKILVWRTVNSDDLEFIRRELEAGHLFFAQEVAPGGNYDETRSTESLTSALTDLVADLHVQAEMPGFNYLRVWRDRLWVMRTQIYEQGKCVVSNGQYKVTGVDEDDASNAPTLWNKGNAGMYFKVDGTSEKYVVEYYIYMEDDGAGADEKQYLTEAYRGSSVTFTGYTIFPRGGRVDYSEERRPWAYSPSTNFFLMDGGQTDVGTGIGYAGNVFLAWTRQQTFGFTYQNNPAEVQEAAPISRGLGNISNDSFAEVDGTAYWLSDRGVARWRQGMGEPDVISQPIHGMFTKPDDPDYVVRDEMTQLALDCQGVHYSPRQQYLLAVKTRKGKHACDTVLAWNYFFQTWHIFRLRNELVRWSWAVDDDGNDVLLFADAFGRFHQWNSGESDGVSATYPGTLRGNVTAATNTGEVSLTDSGASFYLNSTDPSFSTDVLNLDGTWLKIIEGKGMGQVRRIEKNTGTKLYFSQAWDVIPDTTSIYEIAGIDCVWRSKFSNFGQYGRVKTIKFVLIDHKQEFLAGNPSVAVYREFQELSWNKENGIPEQTFSTAEAGRSIVGCNDAAGYNLALEIRADGPNVPLEIRGISVDVTIAQGGPSSG